MKFSASSGGDKLEYNESQFVSGSNQTAKIELLSTRIHYICFHYVHAVTVIQRTNFFSCNIVFTLTNSKC